MSIPAAVTRARTQAVPPTPVSLRDVPAASISVAAGQAGVAQLEVATNVGTAARLVRRAADAGAALLVLPELFLTGYHLARISGQPQQHTLRPDDPRLDELAAVCAQTRTSAVVGAPATDPERGTLHISAFVIGPDGRLRGRYDKQHLDAAELTAGFAPGATGCTLTLGGWRLGLGICWDSSFPEHARAAALDGCQAYLVLALFDRGAGVRKRALLCPARAWDNAGYVVAANHCGSTGPYEGCGGSGGWAPDGTLLADAGQDDPGLAVVPLKPAAVAEARRGDLTLDAPSLDARPGPRALVSLD
ncbi:carbon-nitrogen hydrolase family protein [Catellatospora sichuanensis]|uniref:carbon-nitrogen hydrolase family protein n=1 Tax=Catellatospora sichuanensis TaxID=1969805 RepID=UPI0011823340|nr:carbon-nitrogen hydrolase family protein [Catellatospora sichuanensis]